MNQLRAIPFVVLLLATAPHSARAAVDTIFLVPGSHLDVGFTNLPSVIRRERAAIMDEAIAAMQHDPGFRWTEEGTWAVEQWLAAHRNDRAAIAAVIRLIAQGQFSIGATVLTPHTAVIPELLGDLCADLPMLRQTLHYKPTVAILNDVPSHPQQLIDALAARGVKYLLVGANLNYSHPLPAEMIRRPFYWESEHGRRLLVVVDPDGYFGAVEKYGLGPQCAASFNPRAFPANRSPLEIMRHGVDALLAATPTPFDAIVVQQSLDNWHTDCARDLVQGVALWNRAGMRPVLRVARPDEFFRHVEARYRGQIPVLRAEWGGQWDEIRAVSPAWTWRLREAARRSLGHASHAAQVAMLVAMEHNVHLGEIWPRFYDAQGVRTYARECAAFFRDALRTAGAADLEHAAPPIPSIPPAHPIDGEWSSLVGDRPFHLRCGSWTQTPFVGAGAPPYESHLAYGTSGDTIMGCFRVDRSHLPGDESGDVCVVVEIPLRARQNALRIAPEESPEGRRNRWLRQPQFIVAADGVRIHGLARELTVSSPLIFSWVLVPDPKDASRTLLQGLVTRQTLLCKLKGGGTTIMPFDAWFPGEPAKLEVPVTIVRHERGDG